MDAEIIEFPEGGRENRLASSTARLEAIVRDLERVAADDPAAGVDQLLVMMERMGDQLVDLANLMLDEDARPQAHEAFRSLSKKIAETRDAFGHVEGPKEN